MKANNQLHQATVVSLLLRTGPDVPFVHCPVLNLGRGTKTLDSPIGTFRYSGRYLGRSCLLPHPRTALTHLPRMEAYGTDASGPTW